MKEIKEYGIAVIVSKYRQANEKNWWKKVKSEMAYGFVEQTVPELFQDDWCGILKFFIAKRKMEVAELTEYILIVAHLSEDDNTYTSKIYEIEHNGNKYEKVCFSCGNKLIYDKRDCCEVCGELNGGY